jgi:hypothetical protein
LVQPKFAVAAPPSDVSARQAADLARPQASVAHHRHDEPVSIAGGCLRALKRGLIEINAMVRADIEVPSKKRRPVAIEATATASRA